MLILKLLSGLAFIGSVSWLIAIPDYEPAIASVTSLSALIAIYRLESGKKKAAQSQSIAKNAIGIQAGGDVKVGNVYPSRD